MTDEMTDIVIAGAARTPHGKLLGAFEDVDAVELGATAIDGVLDRTGLAGEDVDWTVMGNATSAGIGQVPARQAAITGGVPKEISATTVNEASGSALRAILLGIDRIDADAASVVLAGGMESMSNTPYLNMDMRGGHKLGDVTLVDSMVRDALWDMMYDAHMGELTEDFNDRFDISREAQDRYALRSNKRAAKAVEQGLFDDEIMPVQTGDGTVKRDEGPRPDTSMEKLGKLPPAFDGDGSITAGNASSLSDGAAAAMLADTDTADDLGLDAMASVVDYAVAYRDPKWFPLAIEDAVEELMDQNDLSVADIDLFELNEAFSSHMVHFEEEVGIPADKLNTRGGAVALGHPIGASGGILTATLVNAMAQEDARYGIVGMCVGGGGGIALLLER